MNSDKAKKGYMRSPHRSLLKAAGYTDWEIERPWIGIANAYNAVIPGHVHLRSITEAVKAGIYAAGGLPIEFPVIGVCDGIAMNHEGMKFSLASRELIMDSIEVMARAHAFDGLVLVPNCDKIVPGMAMAAAELNLPSVVISGGPMMAGQNKGKVLDLNSVFEGVGMRSAGKIDDAALQEIEDNACPGCGSCSGMFTANTMNCMMEVLGLALPGNGTVPAVHAGRIRLAKDAGRAVMDMVNKNIRPRDILTMDAFRNAVAVDLALGGSTNTSLHLPAIAWAAGLEMSLDLFNEIGEKVPHLCSMSPGGAHLCSMSPGGAHHIEDLWRAGGVQALMHELLDAGLIHGETITVTGRTTAENVANAKISDPEVIRPLDKPHHKEGGLAFIRTTKRADSPSSKAPSPRSAR